MIKLDTIGGKVCSLGIVQEIEIWLYEREAYAQPRILPREWDAETWKGFWDTNRSLYLSQTTKPCDSQ